jgi:hypothetical protein
VHKQLVHACSDDLGIQNTRNLYHQVIILQEFQEEQCFQGHGGARCNRVSYVPLKLVSHACASHEERSKAHRVYLFVWESDVCGVFSTHALSVAVRR